MRVSSLAYFLTGASRTSKLSCECCRWRTCTPSSPGRPSPSSSPTAPSARGSSPVSPPVSRSQRSDNHRSRPVTRPWRSTTCRPHPPPRPPPSRRAGRGAQSSARRAWGPKSTPWHTLRPVTPCSHSYQEEYQTIIINPITILTTLTIFTTRCHYWRSVVTRIGIPSDMLTITIGSSGGDWGEEGGGREDWPQSANNIHLLEEDASCLHWGHGLASPAACGEFLYHKETFSINSGQCHTLSQSV